MLFGWLPDRSLAYTINIPQQTVYVVTEGGQPRAIPPPATGQFARALHGLSPDRRWLAYVSNQSGQRETYITAFPEGGVTRQVSRNGGDNPVWAKTGGQLFYRRANEGKPGEILSVAVDPDGAVSAPTVVLTGDYVRDKGAYDPFPDGSFLVLKDHAPAAAPRLEVVVDWAVQRGLKRD